MIVLKFFLCFTVTLNFFACGNAMSSQSQIAETETKITVENSLASNHYAIYDALISDKSLSKDVFGKPDLFVIIDHTNTDYRGDSILNTVLSNVQKSLPSLSDSMIDDFRNKNKIRYSLKDLFNLPTKGIFISNEEFKTILGDKLDWKAFYAKYPNSQGLMTLSNIGFNSDMKRAFVYIANIRGSMNGVGLYVVLEKQNGVCKVK